jgi:nicotinate-nucleotide--dimethylbenzimidazole phosphoribosyltransferase
MVANFLAGGAAINVIARQLGASVTVVDVGVDADLPSGPGLRATKVRRGTRDLAVEAALDRADVVAALDVGAGVAADLVGGGAFALVTGDMGIGNTTPSAAVIAALTGRPAAAVTGRGTGIDDATLTRKVAAVESGLRRLPDGAGPLDVLAEVGGLEIAALAGFVVGGAAARVPVVVDGVIALAGAMAAAVLAPDALGYCVAGHRSTEPGASVALGHLGLEPVLDLGLRLGEGTGACLALPVLEVAARVLAEMATFDTAGVTDKG